MQELLDELIQHGLTPQQAENAVQTVSEWLKAEYPVAGTLMNSWMKNERSTQS